MATMKLGSKPNIFQLEDNAWVCSNELVSDIVIEVGETSFHLHKFPLLYRSGLLQKLISEFRSEDGGGCVLHLHDLPGSARSFEFIAKFCYDVKIELNALNVVTLRCAAEYLQMTEDYVGRNLIALTDNFLDEVLCNWKDSIKALDTCEGVLSQAEELHIVTRCINSLAMKACADPSLFGWPIVEWTSPKSLEGNSVIWNGIHPPRKSNCTSDGGGGGDWWYEDVSVLNLHLYKRLILAMESKGMKAECIAGSLMYYAKIYLPGLTRSSSFHERKNRTNPVSATIESDQRVLLEEIVGMLPMKRGVTTAKFLLRLLRTAMILNVTPQCREDLEKRVGAQLDEAALQDLLIPNLGYSVETLYDVDCVHRILEHFILTDPGIVDEEQLSDSSSPVHTPISRVAKLVDGYLAEVAPDVNLKLHKFLALAVVIPDYARPLDDGIYRAIDIYLKTHPWLTESEREHICRLMNCEKLSLEACTHAAQNERLPLRIVVQVLFFEQLRLRKSIAEWFFVSEESHKNELGLNFHLRQAESEITLEEEEKEKVKDLKVLGAQEMRERIIELEKECLNMKKEIENKLGKPKTKGNGWSIFSRKFGFGSKSNQLKSVRDKLVSPEGDK